MSSEWMKVMLDEIARKKVEAEHALVETERRAAEAATVGDDDACAGSTAAVGVAGHRP